MIKNKIAQLKAELQVLEGKSETPVPPETEAERIKRIFDEALNAIPVPVPSQPAIKITPTEPQPVTKRTLADRIADADRYYARLMDEMK